MTQQKHAAGKPQMFTLADFQSLITRKEYDNETTHHAEFIRLCTCRNCNFRRRACDGEREETAEAQRGIHPRR